MNQLHSETSPYLLQHKDNPVNWFAWGDEAFARAREEKKPIFLSIGYSTCYWCHVMEKESFERDEVAAILNEHFVSIKVDREERPDVDAIYMDAVVQLVGQGGWPMSVFLTPDLKPFYGGTYFPRERFIPLLKQIAGLWVSSNEKVLARAVEFTEFLRSNAELGQANSTVAETTMDDHAIVSSFMSRFDRVNGGFGAAPKFPPTGPMRLLTQFVGPSEAAGNDRGGDNDIKCSDAQRIVEITLDRMAAGGIYDQLGRGFHRYSVDASWLVPHFEKMLYDNALLIRTYLAASSQFGRADYLAVAESCADYVLSEMTSPEGGFYSAEDAGEVGKEGEFYVWTERELWTELSPAEFDLISAVFDILPGGNFEHGANVLSLRAGVDWSVRFRPDIRPIISKLLEIRSRRSRPFRDDKIIVAWNGLMIGAMAALGRSNSAQNKTYLLAAQRAADFLLKNLLLDGELKRTFRAGESRNPGVLDDYAFLIDGLIEIYQSSLDEKYLAAAVELQRKQDELFWDEGSCGYFSTAREDASLIVRKKELMDGAEPSANAIAIGNLARLAVFKADSQFREKAERIVELVRPLSSRYPHGFSYTLLVERMYLQNKFGSCNDGVCC